MNHNETSLPPWDGIGFPVTHDGTVSEMLSETGLDWKVCETPTFAEVVIGGETKRIETGTKAIYRDRDGSLLSVVGENWNPVQNEQAFEFFKEFSEREGLNLHMAGSMNGGKMVFAMARGFGGFEVFGGDVIESHLLMTNPHEYGKRIEMRIMPVRAVSKVTHSLASETIDDKALRVDHTEKFGPQNVRNVVANMRFRMATYRERAQLMGSRKADAETVVEFMQQVYGVDAHNSDLPTLTGRKVTESITAIPGANFAEGTWWPVYNAVTYHADHVASRGGESRLNAAWFGRYAKTKTKALDLACRFAAKSPTVTASNIRSVA